MIAGSTFPLLLHSRTSPSGGVVSGVRALLLLPVPCYPHCIIAPPPPPPFHHKMNEAMCAWVPPAGSLSFPFPPHPHLCRSLPGFVYSARLFPEPPFIAFSSLASGREKEGAERSLFLPAHPCTQRPSEKALAQAKASQTVPCPSLWH